MPPAITLTDDQLQVLSGHHPGPPRVLDPHTNQAFVLLRLDEYRRLVADAYDDGPWTRDDLQAVAWDTAERSGWDAEADDGPADTTAGPR